MCDDHFAHEGDDCINRNGSNHACSDERNAILICRDGKFTKKRDCKGPSACAVRDTGTDIDEILCDNSVADANDACVRGALACTRDGRMKLRCVGGQFVPDNSCRGPKGCLLTNNTLHCDESMAMEGDVCDTASEVTCGMDGKTELLCTAGRFVKKRDCKGQDGCYVRRSLLYCAEH